VRNSFNEIWPATARRARRSRAQPVRRSSQCAAVATLRCAAVATLRCAAAASAPQQPRCIQRSGGVSAAGGSATGWSATGCGRQATPGVAALAASRASAALSRSLSVAPLTIAVEGFIELGKVGGHLVFHLVVSRHRGELLQIQRAAAIHVEREEEPATARCGALVSGNVGSGVVRREEERSAVPRARRSVVVVYMCVCVCCAALRCGMCVSHCFASSSRSTGPVGEIESIILSSSTATTTLISTIAHRMMNDVKKSAASTPCVVEKTMRRAIDCDRDTEQCGAGASRRQAQAPRQTSYVADTLRGSPAAAGVSGALESACPRVACARVQRRRACARHVTSDQPSPVRTWKSV
jgi:hypothetical protein